MIVDEKPIPDVSSTSINWDWKSFQPIDDRQRDELLRKLVRTEIVRAVADDRWQAVRLVPGAYQMIGARLACRVRRIGLVGRTLAKRTGLPQGSINLIGRNMVETKLLFTCRREPAPVTARDLQEGGCSKDVGLHERKWIVDRTIHVRFRRNMQHGYRLI